MHSDDDYLISLAEVRYFQMVFLGSVEVKV